jgi:hypothetical protein
MKILALVLSVGFAVLAGRSAVYWITHRIVLRDTADELLFAAFVTGRVGTWLVAAGMFFVFGSNSAVGQPYIDEVRGFTWLFVVFLSLGATQFLAGWFLGARERSRGSESGPDRGAPRRTPDR